MSEGTRRLQNGQTGGSLSDDEHLLRTLVEQLKTPFIQIARSAELAQLSADQVENSLKTIELLADSTLKLLDAYLLSRRLMSGSLPDSWSPAALTSIMESAAQELSPLAERYQCVLEIDSSSHLPPVMTHETSLKTALVALGQAFISSSYRTAEGPKTIRLAAHSRQGHITTGVFADLPGLSTDIFREARQLHGQAKVPLRPLGASATAAIFIADKLCGLLATPLKVAQHHHLNGLATQLVSPEQLSLVQ